jgi:putative ABC transport system substrate-binding protein
MQAVAAPLSLMVEVVRAQGPSEFSLAFATMAKSRVDSVVVTEDGEFAASFRAIATLALANKLPSIGAREYAEAGGLIGYGVTSWTAFLKELSRLTSRSSSRRSSS